MESKTFLERVRQYLPVLYSEARAGMILSPVGFIGSLLLLNLAGAYVEYNWGVSATRFAFGIIGFVTAFVAVLATGFLVRLFWWEEYLRFPIQQAMRDIQAEQQKASTPEQS